jgi:LmbE family N-acetylglucosaminyl deacetylase
MNLETIADQKIPCYFLSPHLDDAALSAGGLLTFLANKTELTVITFFTQSQDGPESLSVKSFLKQCGYTDTTTLYNDRRAEDKKTFSQFNIPTQHMNYVDALWRTIANPSPLRKAAGTILAEFLYVYPVYRIHIISGNVSHHDQNLVQSIRKDLQKLTANKQKFLFFAPIGIGKNVDHILIRNVAQTYFPAQTLYWTDFPYCLRSTPDENFITTNHLKKTTWNKNLEEKTQLIQGYPSQVDALFPTKPIPKIEEIYYYPNEKLV